MIPSTRGGGGRGRETWEGIWRAILVIWLDNAHLLRGILLSMLDKTKIIKRINAGDSFASIARRFGCSREYIGQVNASVSGERDGFSRKCERQAVEHVEKFARAVEQFLLHPPIHIRKIVRKATKMGLRVEPVRCLSVFTHPYEFLKNRLTVNGHYCSIHVCRGVQYTAPGLRRGYYRVRVVDNQVNFHLIITPIGVFVVPHAMVDLNGKGYKDMYIPERRCDVYNNYPAVDWWEFHEAWDQLKRKQR
jgi:hypothetical protein